MNRKQFYRIVDRQHKAPLFLTSTFQASSAAEKAELFRQKSDALSRAHVENTLHILRHGYHRTSTTKVWRGYSWEVEIA